MIGRRQPCPCGSGEQYRKCCEKKDKSNQQQRVQVPDFIPRTIPSSTSKRPKPASTLKPIDPDSVKVNKDNFKMIDGALKYVGKDKYVKIPETFNGETITKIEVMAFAKSNVEVVFLPKGIEEIENQAFDHCTRLRQINFPEGLKRIGRWSFQGCHTLQSVTLPESLEILDGYAFDECYNLADIKLPAEMQNIGAYAFSETNIKYIKIPNGIDWLQNSLFYACTNLEFVDIPEGVKQILNMTFAECHSLDNVFLPKSLKRIGEQAFQNCINLKTMIIQEEIESIAEHAFTGCENLRNVISTIKKDYIVEILDTNYEVLKSFAGDMTPEEYEKKYNTKFRKTSIENIMRIGCNSAKINNFWTFVSAEELLKLQQSTKVQLYSTLGIELENQTETMYVEELSNYTEEELTEKDLYVETLVAGGNLKERGDYEGAIAKYTEAIAFAPSQATAYYNLGKVLYINKEYEASVRSYKMAIELGANQFEVLSHMGHSLLDEKMKQTKYQDVIEQYEEGINPFLRAKKILSGCSSFCKTISKKKEDEYNQVCISGAEEFLQHELEEEV